MMSAREAVTRRYTAWLERRYPGTRWTPRSVAEVDRPEPVESATHEIGGRLSASENANGVRLAPELPSDGDEIESVRDETASIDDAHIRPIVPER